MKKSYRTSYVMNTLILNNHF